MPAGLKVMRSLLLTIFLGYSSFVAAQNRQPELLLHSMSFSPGLQFKPDNLPDSYFNPVSLPRTSAVILSKKHRYPVPALPVVYSVNNLPFFCKWEVKMEKAAAFPVKFRLGEVQYVEHLEGKY